MYFIYIFDLLLLFINVTHINLQYIYCPYERVKSNLGIIDSTSTQRILCLIARYELEANSCQSPVVQFIINTFIHTHIHNKR